MKRSLVHLLLGILICVTSLQGVAAGLLACCGVAPASRQHAAADQGAGHHAHPARAAEHQHAAQSCSSCLACCSAPAALPAATLAMSLFQAESRFPLALPAPGGHIPDTPERPPRRQIA
ncbi:hypothetical protein [Massilia litorea]|jgi:hypothetical protein|uniref:DUF2946 domain-containing protein n=1 Tax=Massilia litorea TaxID=2769491 RepID=A0A7L9UDH5_9BURK|nr:hypothetical protein [Massilia litorea]QOL52206.1 hypothetical protein LPB04_23635 [Massilia litorea]